MRPRSAAAWVVACALPGAYACVDLFHSTADVLDKCQLDAAACPLDFCKLPSQTAENFAEHACAWLGACESPLGGNAFGPCMVQARLAFDCNLNPNHPVKGQVHALWDCLARVRTCSDVRQCIVPGAPATCTGGTGDAVCIDAGSDTTRTACSDGTTVAENCALWGQTCDPRPSSAVCGVGAASPLDCTTEGTPGLCDSTKVHWCGDSGDVGIDCAGNGAGRCGIFPTRDAATSWPACEPESVPESDGGCDAGQAVSCTNDIATSCPAGTVETLHCGQLLGPGGSCSDAGLDPPFDWTSACSGGSGCQDSCDAGVLTGCARGASFVTDCAAAGLGACRLVTTIDDAGPRAACQPR